MPEKYDRQNGDMRKRPTGNARKRPTTAPTGHFLEAPGEAEADAAGEVLLRRTGLDPDEVASALAGTDSVMRARTLGRLQRERGNTYVQRVVEAHQETVGETGKTGQPAVQRQNRGTVRMQGETIRADPANARAGFQRIRESVQSYSDNCLDYLSLQYLSAMFSFQNWYARQDKADASFFNAVVDVLNNSAGAWGAIAGGGAATAGGVVPVVGSVIMLVAQEAARSVQAARDDFAAGLTQSANNFQSGLQRRLKGKVPELLARSDPTLWDDIQRNAYLGEEWQSLLHERAGLPRPGEDYQQTLLSRLIFKYREWEHSQHSASYRGIYSMADPYLDHMRGRAEAEAYTVRGEPIPRRLREYARPGEPVAPE